MQAIPALFAGGASAGALTAASIGLTLVGTAANIASANAEARAQQQQYQYQQQVAMRNAEIAEENAAKAIATANAEAQEKDYLAAAEIGELIAQQSASGIRGNVGSNYLRRKSLQALARKDRGFIVAGGVSAAADERTKAEDYRAEAEQYNAAISNTKKTKGLRIASSLISGASTINRTKFESLTARSK